MMKTVRSFNEYKKWVRKGYKDTKKGIKKNQGNTPGEMVAWTDGKNKYKKSK